ncbi:glycosyltransferase family 2 protein [Hydrogenimonas urashimensis]|uniref:glycosyltransferase family 2 protein n=1 Tax=Hydrogenimonas urashimensis TaxID=2740515 RepID=UPI001916BEC4|nr:glycosyltransferase family 2 protein [Hydrogenimonas urashimensis]
MKKFELTIIVPVYNEIENLPRLGAVLRNYLDRASRKSCVLFVDDGSTDGSGSAIHKLCREEERFFCISFRQNRGLSTAIKAGIDYCDTPILGYIDADLQTTPEDFELLLPFIEEYDAVVGYRTKRKDSWSKKIQSKIANAIRRCMIDDGIIDTGCPLKLFRTDICKKIPFFDGMHRFWAALVLLENGRVKQVPVRHFERIAGKSKFNFFNRSIRPLQDMLAFRWMKNRYIHYVFVSEILP